MGRGSFEDQVAKLADYEGSDLPERTKAALRLADRLSGDHRSVDRPFHEALRRHFSDEEILDLGMCIAFASGWQRFVEAFQVVPDRWVEGDPPPWAARGAEDRGPAPPPA